MSDKITVCKTCGAEVAASAKSCPKCGAKNKKPFYKKWWFYSIIVILFFAIIGSSGDGESSDTPDQPAVSNQTEDSSEPAPAITYTHYKVTELFDILSSNALKAEKTFQDQYVEIEAYLSNIDSDGNYISIGANPTNYDYLFQRFTCNISNDALLDQVIELNIGDPITIQGQITEVGEVLGYTLELDNILS